MTRHVLVRVAASIAAVIAVLGWPAVAVAQLVVGPAGGGNPQVSVIEGTDTRTIQVYDPLFLGGVNATLGDVNGDGTLDIITGAGPTGGPHVRVFSGTDLSQLASFYAYDPAFTGGVSVAAGDVDGDGHADIITGAGRDGGGPHVRVFSGADLSDLASFYAYDPAFTGGVSVAAGDVDGDGLADIITGAGPTGGPHVIVFSGRDLSVVFSFYAYDPAFTGGVHVAAGDFNGDGLADIITGAGPTGGPHVAVFSGLDLTYLASFYAFDAAFTGGVSVATGDINADGRVDLILGEGPGGRSVVRVLSGTDLTELDSFVAPITGNGVSVGSMGDAGGVRFTSATSTTLVTGSAGTFTVTTTGFPVGLSPTLTVSGALPTGVTFVDNGDGTATLAGTPGASTFGDYALTFTASNGVSLPKTQNFTLTVTEVSAITSANATNFAVGVAGSFTVTTTGSPLSTITASGTLPTGVTFVDNGDGTAALAGTPATGTDGTYPLTFTANNNVGVPATQAFTLTVSAPQGPAITSVSATAFTVGAAGSFTVTTTGAPAPTLTVGGVLPFGVTFVDNGNGTGTLSGTPPAGAGGIYGITFTAANGIGAPAVQSFTLTVNQGPAVTSANAVAFALAVPGTFTVTTTGFPAPALARGGVALPAGVTFTDNGNGTGTLSGTPAAGTGGAYAITFSATNGVGVPVTQAFTLTVQDAPTITSASAATFTVGTPGSFTVTTSGLPAPTLTVGGASLPSGVSFVDNGNGTGTLGGTPVAGTAGTYAITFTATNGIGAPAVQSFTLTVNQEPAVTSANAVTFAVAVPGTFTVTTTGFPAPALAQGGVALPTGVTFADNGNGTGTLSGMAAAGTAGAYAITFTATNGVGAPVTQAFTLTVMQAPAITSANATTFTVGTPGSFTVTTTGFPPPSLTLGGASLPAGVTFVDNGTGIGTLSGTPAAGTAGVYAITFTASNGAGVPVVQPFTLIVGDVPVIDLDLDDDGGTPPTTGNDFAITFAEGGPPQFIEDEVDATITDVDSPNLTSITVTITNVLDALQEKLDVDLVTGGFAANFTKSFDETTTPGVAVLTITATTPQPLADFNTLLRRVTYQNLDPGADTTAPRTITFVVNDGVGNSNTATTTVTITATDDPPTADNDSYTVAEGGTLTITAPGVLDGDTDPEGDTPITAVIETGPANASAFTLNSDGSFTYTHDGSETTTDSFTYRAVANGLQSAPATVTITITAVNDAPAITAGGILNFIEGNPATAIDGTVLVTDADDTNLESATVVIAGNYVNGQDILALPVTAGITGIFTPATGTLTLTGSVTVAAYQSALRSVTYFNNSGTPSVAPRTVTWVVNDGTVSSNIAASTITVTAVNSAPIGVADAWTTFGNTDLVVDQAGPSTPFVADTTTSTFGVLDNDTDPENDPRSVAGIVGCADTTAPYVCTTTAGGSVTMESNGRFTYRPQAGDTGTDSFQYILTDAPSSGVPATANVTVNLTLQERIWYVDGDVAGPGTGTSSDPFSALPATAGDADDYIFVHDSTVTGGITLQNGQKLYGEAFGLSINQSLNGNPAPVVLVAPGGSPNIAASTGNAIGVLANTASGNLTNVEIRGLTLATTAASSNAIDITSANAANVAVTISGVIVTGATAEGIDINQGSTGSATVSMTNVTVTSTGTGIDLNETAGTLTVTGFSGITITGNTGGSGIVVTNATFDATAGGAYNQVAGGATAVGTLANPVGGAGVVLTNISGDLAFTDLDIFTTNGAGLLVSGTGAVNVGAGTGTRVTVASGVGTLQSIGGPVLDITNATVDLPLDSATVTSSPTTGISLVNVASGTTAASVSATSGSIASTTGISVNVSGGTVSLNYGGNITQTSNNAMVNVTGGHTTGTITFSGTLNATNGSGLQFDNADSTTSYNFTGTTTLNGGDAGIDILNGSAGTFTFGTGTTISNPTGTAFLLSGSNANVTYSGSISDNSGFAADIDNHDAGTVTFQTGSITSNGTGTGIRVANSNGGTINFNSPTIALTTGANKAVTLDVGNAGGTINFAPAGGGNGLDITTTTGIGFSALGGGTISVSGAGNTITSNGAMAIDVENTIVGAGGITFAFTSSGGGANNVKLASVTGGAIALGSGGLVGATAAAFLVGDGAGGANTGGTAAITYGGAITSTGTARAVDIQDRAAGAGNITLSGTITHSSGNANVIFLDGNAAGTIAFSGANSVLNGGTSTAVSLTNNTGATINFTGGGLDIDATSGSGFVATGGGTINVTGTGNTIATTTGTALNVANTTIGASGLTFQSISANGAQRGIALNTTGAGAFTVTGTGTTDGSGGTIQAATSRGAELISTGSIALSNMNFTGNGTAQTVAGNAATCGGDLTGTNNLSCVSNIHLQSITGVTLTNLNVTNGGQMGINGNNVSGFSLIDSVVTGNGNEGLENGLTFQNLTGTSAITNSIIRDNAAYQVNITNTANNSTLVLNVTGTRTNNAYPTMDTSTTEIGRTSPSGPFTNQGFLFNVSTAATNLNATINFTGVVFNNTYPGNAVLLNPIAASGSFAGTTTNSSFDTSGGGLIIQMQNGMTGNYTVTNSEFYRTALQQILYSGLNPYNATFQGVIQGNTIGAAASGSACFPTTGANCVGIDVNLIGGTGAIRTRIQSNTVQQFDGVGIRFTANGAGSLHANVVSNTVQNPLGLVARGIDTNIGTTTGAAIVGCFTISSNTVTGTFEDPGVGTQLGINTRVRFNSEHRLPGMTGTGTANAQTFLNTSNSAGGKVFTQGNGVPGYQSGAACTTP